MSRNQELPFALLMWIKRDQEERLAHQERMAVRRFREDEEFIRLIGCLLQSWDLLKEREQAFIRSLVTHRQQGRNFSTAQRSAIAGMYVRLCNAA